MLGGPCADLALCRATHLPRKVLLTLKWFWCALRSSSVSANSRDLAVPHAVSVSQLMSLSVEDRHLWRAMRSTRSFRSEHSCSCLLPLAGKGTDQSQVLQPLESRSRREELQPQQLNALLQPLSCWATSTADSAVVPQSSGCHGADPSIWVQGVPVGTPNRPDTSPCARVFERGRTRAFSVHRRRRASKLRLAGWAWGCCDGKKKGLGVKAAGGE